MPLGVILRDVLGVAQNKREAKKIAHSRQVKVDGELETDIGRCRPDGRFDSRGEQLDVS